MAKKTNTSDDGMSKTQRIKAYLAQNPGHTWKKAEPSLAQHDISGQYFGVIKSKLNSEGLSAGRKPGRRGRPAKGTAPQLNKAISFARDCGGIDYAIQELEKLRSYQI